MRRYADRQKDALGVFTLALIFVLAYSLWGSYVLHQQRVAEASGPAVADLR